MLEAADVIQKLYIVAQDLPTDQFGIAKKKIEMKYDEVERNLIEEFATAQKNEDIEKMKELANILSQFKGYAQCVDVYIELSQAVSLMRKIQDTFYQSFVNSRQLIMARTFLIESFHYVGSTMKSSRKFLPVLIK